MHKRERKAFRFELKEVGDAGQFVGLASVYGNVDLGGDVVDRGAFTKTIAERGAEVPILWQHDPKIPIGLGSLEDSADGLVIKGQLDLDVEEGARAYSGMKKGYLKGLSIGYDTVKQAHANGARHLKELKLYEVSTVTFPMNEDATVSRVKAFDPVALDLKALGLPPALAAIADVVLRKDASLVDKLSDVYAAIREAFPFGNAYVVDVFDTYAIVGLYDDSDRFFSIALSWTDDADDPEPILGDVTEVERVYVPLASDAGGTKAGRVLSAANHEKLKAACDYMTKAVDHVSAVVAAAEPKDPKAITLGTSRKEAAAPAPDAAIELAELGALLQAHNARLRQTH